MDKKDIFLVIGLVLVLSVVVSLTTVSLTGQFTFASKFSSKKILNNTIKFEIPYNTYEITPTTEAVYDKNGKILMSSAHMIRISGNSKLNNFVTTSGYNTSTIYLMRNGTQQTLLFRKDVFTSKPLLDTIFNSTQRPSSLGSIINTDNKVIPLTLIPKVGHSGVFIIGTIDYEEIGYRIDIPFCEDNVGNLNHLGIHRYYGGPAETGDLSYWAGNWIDIGNVTSNVVIPILNMTILNPKLGIESDDLYLKIPAI